MLWFAYWSALGGGVCSLGLAFLAWLGLPSTSYAARYIALLIGIFVTFRPSDPRHSGECRAE
jgi:hypothetical protein